MGAIAQKWSGSILLNLINYDFSKLLSKLLIGMLSGACCQVHVNPSGHVIVLARNAGKSRHHLLLRA
ncbi:MAG TPA: hypothetical protein VNW51_08290 [Mucilaginibacter sp.]|nr:hypothetical protein [Mucilaginibacter sp.]